MSCLSHTTSVLLNNIKVNRFNIKRFEIIYLLEDGKWMVLDRVRVRWRSVETVGFITSAIEYYNY